MIDNEMRTKKIIVFIIGILIISLFIFLVIYLGNKNYISNVEFKLNGPSVIEIEEGTIWQDPLVIANYKGKSIISEVEISGNVNVAVPGQYKITYIIKKGFSENKLTRIVLVKVKNDNFILNLKGNSTIYISKGSEYKEPGYNAYYNNLDVSKDVIVSGYVNTLIPGEYSLKYSVLKNGYSREKIRLINVVEFKYQLELIERNKIIFKTTDSNYDHILLPDNNVSYSNNVTYEVKKNGEYKFIIYNKLGFVETKTIKVTNADVTAPTGTCIAYLYDNYTNVVVNASDDGEIDGYEYSYGSKKSGKISKNEFKYYENINEVNVNIYDKADHKTNIKCTTIDKSSSVLSSYKSYTFVDPTTSRQMKYWLYIPDNLTARNSVPLMIYLHGDGGRSNNINDVNLYAYPRFIKDGTKYPFMMIAPQINYDTNWTNETTYQRVMRIVDYIIENYNVNTKKIILAGGSSGGGGAYKITSAYPNYFSCTVVGSGIYSSSYRNFASQLINTPMWVFHGTEDGIDHGSVKSFAEYINSLGGKVKFVSIPGGRHSVTETIQGFKNPDLIEWMLKQERN